MDFINISSDLVEKLANYIEDIFEPIVLYQKAYGFQDNFEEDEDLLDVLEKVDISFSELLFKTIKEKNISEVECYKKANIDRKLFSKIRNDLKYRPSKKTVISLAISLELSIHKTTELLSSAGFTLSKSDKFDIIVRYFIENKSYDLMLINSALFFFCNHTLEK